MAVGNIVYGVVGLTVFVLIAATCLIPVVQDAQESQVTTFQNSAQTYDMNPATGFTIVQDYGVGYTINGQSFSATATTFAAFGMDFYIIMYNNSNMKVMTDGDAINGVSSVSLSGSTLSVTVSGVTTTYTVDSSKVFVLSNSGTYGYFNPSASWNVDPNSKIYVLFDKEFKYSSDTYQMRGMFAGTIADIDFVWSIDNNDTVSASAGTLTYTATDMGHYYNVPIQAPGITLTISGDDFEGQGEAAADIAFIAPLAYHDVTASDSSNASLLGIIPLMVIIAAVMLAVGLMKGRI